MPLLEYHQFPIENCSWREVCQEAQFRKSRRQFLAVATNQSIASLIHKGQRAYSIPLDFKQVSFGVEGLSRTGQHRADERG